MDLVPDPPLPSPPPPPPTLVEEEHAKFAKMHWPEMMGEDIVESKTFAWKVSWDMQTAQSIRSPTFSVGGHEWAISIHPNLGIDSTIVSLFLNLLTPERFPTSNDHLCVRVMLAMSVPGLTTTNAYVDTRDARYSPRNRVFGFPHFEDRSALVRRCVRGDDSQVTVFIRILRDEGGYLFHNFAANPYDSRAVTGEVGLKETNSNTDAMLIAMYHIPAFRRAVYRLPVGDRQRLTLELQRVFCAMEHSAEQVDPHDLKDAAAVGLLANLPRSFFSKKTNGFDELTMAVLGVEHSSQPTAWTDLLLLRSTEIIGRSVDTGEEWTLSDVAIVLDAERYTTLATAIPHFITPSDPDIKLTTSYSSWAPIVSFTLQRSERSNHRPFNFPFTLDLAPFLDNISARSRPLMYRLQTIVIVTESGAIFSFTRPRADGPWLQYRHGRVVPVAERLVINVALGEHRKKCERSWTHSLVYVGEDLEKYNVKGGAATVSVREHVAQNYPLKKDSTIALREATTLDLIEGAATLAVMVGGAALLTRWLWKLVRRSFKV